MLKNVSIQELTEKLKVIDETSKFKKINNEKVARVQASSEMDSMRGLAANPQLNQAVA